MNWDDFRIISAICKTGSFGRAARALQIDETTVGRRVSRIEKTLEMVLFDPSDGMRRPTEACLAIMRPLHDMEVAAESITRTLQGQEPARRVFRLSTIAAIAEHWLAPQIPALLEELPDLSLSIDTSDDNVDMSRWEADFALRLGRPRRGAFLMRRIGEIGFSLVRPRTEVPGGEILAAYPPALAETPEMRALGAMFRGRATRLETTNLGLIRTILASGRGVGLLPDAMAEDLAVRQDVIVTPTEVGREIWLLSQPHLKNDPLARRLTEWCANLFPARRVQASATKE